MTIIDPAPAEPPPPSSQQTTFTIEELLDEIKTAHIELRKLANQPGPCECPYCVPIHPEDNELLDEMRKVKDGEHFDLLQRGAIRIQELLEHGR